MGKELGEEDLCSFLSCNDLTLPHFFAGLSKAHKADGKLKVENIF